MNPFYQAFRGNAMNPMQMLTQLKSNPMELMKRAGFNVPSNVTNPQAIIQHLMNSGQLTQQQLTQAQQAAQSFGIQ